MISQLAANGDVSQQIKAEAKENNNIRYDVCLCVRVWKSNKKNTKKNLRRIEIKREEEEEEGEIKKREVLKANAFKVC